MTNDEHPRKYQRGRFIATHLGVVLAASIFFGGSGSYGFLVPLIAIAAPLALIPGARRPDIVTLIMSTVTALFIAACVFGIGILLLASALGKGRV